MNDLKEDFSLATQHRSDLFREGIRNFAIVSNINLELIIFCRATMELLLQMAERYLFIYT